MMATTDIAPLTDLLQIVGGIGVVVGAIFGLAMPAPTARDIANNITIGAGVGLVAGTIVAFVVGGVDLIVDPG